MKLVFVHRALGVTIFFILLLLAACDQGLVFWTERYANVAGKFQAVEHEGEPFTEPVPAGSYYGCPIETYTIILDDSELDASDPDHFRVFLGLYFDPDAPECIVPYAHGAGTYLSTHDSLWQVTFDDPTSAPNAPLPTGYWTEFGERFETQSWTFERCENC